LLFPTETSVSLSSMRFEYVVLQCYFSISCRVNYKPSTLTSYRFFSAAKKSCFGRVEKSVGCSN